MASTTTTDVREEELQQQPQQQKIQQLEEQQPDGGSKWRKILPLVASIAFPAAIYYVLLKYGYVHQFLLWTASLGYIGNGIMVVLLIAFAFPFAFGSSVIGMACGFLYGFNGGFITLTIGQLCGYSIAFHVIRQFRSYFTEIFGSDKRAKFFLHAIEQQPIKIGLLMRYIPIPSGIQTTILALSKINYVTFICTSVIAELPLQFLIVSLGTEIGNLSSILSGETGLQPKHIIVLVLEVVGTLVLVGTLVVVGRKSELAQAEAQVPPPV